MKLRFLVLVLLGGCALKGSLVGGSTLGTSSTSAEPASPAINQPTEVPAGLSEYATRFIRYTNELKADCPVGPTPPSSAYGECIGRERSTQNLYASVEEKSHPQVQQGAAYLAELRKSVAKWEADEKTAGDQRAQNDKVAGDIDRAAHHGRELVSQLTAARAGKITSTLISFEHRDADYVARRVEMLRKEMPFIETIAKGCAAGGGTKDLCDVAANRDKYFTKLMALQFEAILAERLKAWTNTIDTMKRDGLVAVINYNLITDPGKFGAKLGKDLAEIGKALGQSDTQKPIDAALAKLTADFRAAVRARQATNAWAAHASEARYQDARVAPAIRQIPNLKLVRAAVTRPTWDVVRGNFNKPIKRQHYAWALMRKSGESFCRLYPFFVVQDHLGGGRYGAAYVEANGVAEFYVSACK